MLQQHHLLQLSTCEPKMKYKTIIEAWFTIITKRNVNERKIKIWPILRQLQSFFCVKRSDCPCYFDRYVDCKPS